MAPVLQSAPARPEGINPINRVVTDKTKSFVVADAYSSNHKRVLAVTTDDVENEISFRAYDNMEKDSTVAKVKRILITTVLSDDLQLAPGATEDEVGKSEYDTHVAIQEFCERVLEGLDKSPRESLAQLAGNGFKYGHGIAETEWEYRLDAPTTKPVESDTQAPKGWLASAMTRFSAWMSSNPRAAAKDGDSGGSITKPALKNEKTRLMPSSIKVKPRNTVRFVVDDYMNVLGLAPANKTRAGLAYDEIVDREKFMVFTVNKEDEDPRGKSMYRPAVNWYNLRTQIPAEMMRYILEESVPKAVGTLPPDMPPFEFERDEDGQIIYNDPDTKLDPRMLTAAESFKRQIEGFRSGSGAVIPYQATLEPYRKGLTGSTDADMWGKLLKTTGDRIEECILLQTLAQSEGEHQARSAAQQVAEILYTLVFWTRWQLAMVVLIDLLAVSVKINFGDWALRYLPVISLGDFVNRDWTAQLAALADAYFKGFLDDTQRAELMALMNLPKPGPSRQEQNMEATAKADVNGNPGQPNDNRPDKNTGAGRNNGNGTEKKNGTNTGRGPNNLVGDNSRWFGRTKTHIRAGRRS